MDEPQRSRFPLALAVFNGTTEGFGSPFMYEMKAPLVAFLNVPGDGSGGLVVSVFETDEAMEVVPSGNTYRVSN